jgi:hypothetical protein
VRSGGRVAQLARALYPLHAARGGGRFKLTPALLAGLGVVWLAAIGTLAWLRRASR